MMARFRNLQRKKSQDFKKAQCVSNECKDLFKQKKYFGFMGTLIKGIGYEARQTSKEKTKMPSCFALIHYAWWRNQHVSIG